MAEDSSNTPKVEEVLVESVKTLDIVTPVADEEGKREISILDEIADEAKKLLHRTKSSSSSSSDSDDEKKEKEKEKEVKAKHSFAESLGIGAVPAVIQGLVVNVEEKFNSTFDDDKKEKLHGFVSNMEEKIMSAFKHDHDKKESGEKNVGEASNDDTTKPVSEPPIESINAQSCEIPETTPNTAHVVPVTSASLQESSTWKSCCGLIEVLRPSQR